MRNKLKWDLAKPLKRPDYIQSSDFQNSAPFVPSYEKNPVHDMHKLLEMEYSGKWHDERYLWDRRVFPPAERSYFCRKYVIRGPNKKYATKTPPKPFKMKRFINIPSKTDHTRPPAKEVPRPKYVTDRENKYAPEDGVTVARSPQPVGGSPQPIIEDKCVCTPTKKRADEEPKKSSQSLRSDKSDSTSSGKRSKASSQGKDPGANDVANKENFDQSNEKKESRGSSKGEKSAADLAEDDKRSRQSTRSHTSSVSISSLATCPGFSIKSGASSTKSREAKGEKYCPKDRPCPAKLLEEKEQASEKSLPLSNKGSVDKRVCCKRNIGMESKPGCLGRHN